MIALAGYNWVVDNFADLKVEENNISVGGDSAGGNLAAAICLKQQEVQQHLPPKSSTPNLSSNRFTV